jgi:hypothetical protein
VCSSGLPRRHRSPSSMEYIPDEAGSRAEARIRHVAGKFRPVRRAAFTLSSGINPIQVFSRLHNNGMLNNPREDARFRVRRHRLWSLQALAVCGGRRICSVSRRKDLRVRRYRQHSWCRRPGGSRFVRALERHPQSLRVSKTARLRASPVCSARRRARAALR